MIPTGPERLICLTLLGRTYTAARMLAGLDQAALANVPPACRRERSPMLSGDGTAGPTRSGQYERLCHARACLLALVRTTDLRPSPSHLPQMTKRKSDMKYFAKFNRVIRDNIRVAAQMLRRLSRCTGPATPDLPRDRAAARHVMVRFHECRRIGSSGSARFGHAVQ